MINITNYIKSMNVHSQLVSKYLAMLSPKNAESALNLFHNTALSLSQREKNYEALRQLGSQLKEIFKQRIIESNKIAKAMGYANHLEYFLTLNAMALEDFKSFVENIDKFISSVQCESVAIERSSETKDWSIFSIPSPEGIFYMENKFDVPSQILDLVSTYDSRIAKYRNKIDMKLDDDSYSGVKYLEGENKVRIRLRKDIEDLDRALVFVQGLGNALDLLDCVENKITPHISKYLQDYSAIEFTHKFIRREISEKGQMLIKYNMLHDLVYTLFEIEVFVNDKQDFDIAYAKAINRCYPTARQTENPLYVFDSRFIVRPLGMLIQNMVDMELYLKKGESSSDML
ncbi:MAG: hypothetical protein Q8M92_07040 [Candidatus Subteraquimicrobiales bacterium]|nr:hypothetical protein [Candidatus Subteraquimicrobiales bacterium]